MTPPELDRLRTLQAAGWLVSAYGYVYDTAGGLEHRRYLSRAVYTGERWEDRAEQSGLIVLETGRWRIGSGPWQEWTAGPWCGADDPATYWRGMFALAGLRVQREGYQTPQGLHHLAWSAHGQTYHVDLQTGRWQRNGDSAWQDWRISLDATPPSAPPTPSVAPEPQLVLLEPKPFVSMKERPVQLRGANRVRGLFG